MKDKKKKEWEDAEWEKDYRELRKEWGVPLEEPKEKVPLLVRLKIKERYGKWNPAYIYTRFSKILLTTAIIGVVGGAATFGGIRQWRWHDEIIWGEKVSSFVVETPYRYISTTNPYMDYYEVGDKVPCIVRQRIIKNPKPWKKSFDGRHLGSDYEVGPVRLDLDTIEKHMNGM